MLEEWKDIYYQNGDEIIDYRNLYQVSNYGKVRSLDRIDSNNRFWKGRILKQKKTKRTH